MARRWFSYSGVLILAGFCAGCATGRPGTSVAGAAPNGMEASQDREDRPASAVTDDRRALEPDRSVDRRSQSAMAMRSSVGATSRDYSSGSPPGNRTSAGRPPQINPGPGPVAPGDPDRPVIRSGPPQAAQSIQLAGGEVLPRDSASGAREGAVQNALYQWDGHCSPANRPPVMQVGGPTMSIESVTATANATVPPPAPPSQSKLAGLIASAEAEAAAASPGETDAQRQNYVKKQVDLRLLYLVSGQHERALQAIPGLDPVDQEFWQQTLWGLTNYFDSASIPSSPERAAQTVAQLQNAILRLQEKANLELHNVSFCHRISSFGNYEKYVRDEFSPGQEVLLYAEVANIHSEPIVDGKFRTSLKSTLEILRHQPAGEGVERIELPETVDICRTHRRDYFHSYQFTIPTKLAPGAHVLKLTVEDQLSRRVATYSLNFTVK